MMVERMDDPGTGVEDTSRLCDIRGPERILIGPAQRLGTRASRVDPMGRDPEDAMPVTRERTDAPPEARLRVLIGRLDPKQQKLVRSIRAAMRKRFPTANELAYDYDGSLVIGYSPTDRGIDAIVAISARATGVSLQLNQGPRLPDPKRILMGSGKMTRHIPIEAAGRLAHPDVKALIDAAVGLAGTPLPSSGKGRLIIKSAAAKRRARGRPTR